MTPQARARARDSMRRVFFGVINPGGRGMQGACLRPLIPNGIKNFGQKVFHFPILRNGWKQKALFPNALSQFEGRIAKGV